MSGDTAAGSAATAGIAKKVERGKRLDRDLAKLAGRAWVFGDGVSTDLIAPGRYFDLRSDLDVLAEHTLEDGELGSTDEAFMEVMEPGDIVVGGRNFGQGSSREHAPAIIERVGVSAVVAESFARIFYRNAVNVGLPVVECDTDGIEDGDDLRVDLEAGVLVDETQGIERSFDPLPAVMTRLLRAGGLKAHVEEHGSLALE